MRNISVCTRWLETVPGAVPMLLESCQECPLWATATQVVPGEGPLDAEIMFVGEGPGFHEDQQGRPFVGPAGKALNYILSDLGIKRVDVRISNLVKHRPPQNRVPIPPEIAACKHWLDEEIAAMTNLKLIVCLGGTAAGRYFPDKAPLGSLRMLPNGVLCISCYHPAFFLRGRRPAIRKQIIDAIATGVELCSKRRAICGTS